MADLEAKPAKPDIDLEPQHYRPSDGTERRKDKPREPILHPMWPLGIAAMAFPFGVAWVIGWMMTNWGWWTALIVIGVTIGIAGLIQASTRGR